MSLAHVIVSVSEFDRIHSHLLSHMPQYRNMHLRQARIERKKRVLRYLHAMHASAGATKVEGVISGPDVFWQYELIRYKSRTQLNLLDEQAPPKALERIKRTFLTEILNRIDQERQGRKFAPKRLSGQYYLIRNSPGSDPTDPDCQRAVGDAVLDPEFVAQLSPWSFRLFRKP